MKDLDFELVMCWIEKPAGPFAAGTVTPIGIDKDAIKAGVASETLNITLNSFVLTDEPECGTLVYEFSDSNTANPGVNEFADGGRASYSDGVITYTDLGSIPPTTTALIVTLKVR